MVPKDLTPDPHQVHALKDMDSDGVLDEAMLTAFLGQMFSAAVCCQMLYRDGKPDDCIYLYTNAAFHQQTGLGPVCGKRFSEVVPGIRESDPELLAVYGRVAAGGAPERFEVFVEALGQWRSVQVLCIKPGYFLALFDVVTKSKRDEQALFESEARFHALIEHNHAVVLQIDPTSGQILDANVSACKFYGWSHEALCSMKIEDINRLNPDQVLVERMAALHEQRNYFIFPHRLANGDIRTVEVYSTPVTVQGRDILVSIIHDITDRKRMENRLKESEAFMQSILDSMISQIAVLDQNGVIVAVNEPWRRFALENSLQPGVPAPRTGVGVNYFEICSSDSESEAEDRVNAAWGIRAVIDSVLPTFSLEYPCHSTTEQRWFRMVVTPFGNARPGRVVVTHTNITMRVLHAHRIEVLVREQKAMLENELIGIVTIRNRWIVWANPAFEKMLGFGHGELAGVPTRQLYASEEAYEALGRTANSLLQHDQIFRSEVEFVRKDGVHIWADANGSKLDHSVGESLWGFIDITQRKQLEDAAVLSEKRMEMALAGGDLATWDWHIPSGALIFNARWAEIQGYTLDELAPRVESWETSVHPDDLPGAKESLALHFKGITAVYESEHRVLHKDGHWVWVVGRGKVLERDSDANPIRMLGTAADISDRKYAEDKLRQLSVAVEQSSASVVITDLNASIEYVNAHFTEVTGYSLAESIGKNPRIFKSGLTSNQTYEAMWSRLCSGLPWQGEMVNRRKNGEHYWEDVQIAPVKNPLGAVTHYLAVKSDITAYKKVQEELQQSQARLKLIFDQAPLGIALIDSITGQIYSANRMFARMTGKSEEEVLQMDWRSAAQPHYAQADRDNMAALFAGKISGFQLETRYVRADSTSAWIHMTIAAVDVKDKAHPRHLCMVEDITERKQMEEQIHQFAFHDTLTNLPNRRLLLDRLTQAMAAGKRSEAFGALMFLDLDNFKALNDEHGHRAGDLLLVEVARRLRACVRAVDTVSRLGGDEFVVLLSDLTMDQVYATEQAKKLAEKIRITLERPCVLAGANAFETIDYHCSASIGVVLFSKEHQDPADLLKWADMAMYRSKAAGRNCITFLTERRAKQRLKP